MKRVNNRHRRGVAVVYVALTFFVLLGVVGLALDTARVYVAAHELQNAADASALAGAAMVETNAAQARNQARFIASRNTVEGVAINLANNPSNGADGEVVIGYYSRGSRTFTPGLTEPNAVKVRARRTAERNGSIPLIFGKWFGTSTSSLERGATAMLGSKNAGVIVLNEHLPESLDFMGTGNRPKIDVNLVDANGVPTGEHGAVIVNSDSPTGFSWSGNPVMEVQDLYLGSNQPNAQSTLPAGSTLHLNQDPTPDPLKPLYSGPPAKPTKQAKEVNGVWEEGYYSNGIPKDAVLGPGLHWVDGGIDGGITAEQGSLLFVNTGDISLKGNDVLKVRRITNPNSPYAEWTNLGISIWIKEGNLNQTGTPDIDNNGVLYLTGQAPGGGHAEIRGTPTSIGSLLITDTLAIRGTGIINISHGPEPTKMKRVFLVE